MVADRAMLGAGFAMTGTEVRTTSVSVDEKDVVEVTSGRHKLNSTGCHTADCS